MQFRSLGDHEDDDITDDIDTNLFAGMMLSVHFPSRCILLHKKVLPH